MLNSFRREKIKFWIQSPWGQLGVDNAASTILRKEQRHEKNIVKKPTQFPENYFHNNDFFTNFISFLEDFLLLSFLELCNTS